ncbi:MAG: shikimate kinase [Alkalispirochaetaceae bacterium]
MHSPHPPRRLIAITGLKHSGKSSLAPRIARILALPALDLDEEALRAMRSDLQPPGEGSSLRAYFRTYGAELFQRYEVAALASLLRDQYRGILACGGGIVDNGEAMELLEGASLIVYLTAEFDILYERIIRGGIPPFLDSEDPRGSFLKLAQKRDAAYRKAAHLIVSVSDRSPAEAAVAVATEIKESENARQ